MQNFVQICLNDQTVIETEVSVVESADYFVKLHELRQDAEALLLEMQHGKLVTTLELSKVSPFVLLYFTADYQFFGAAYSLHAKEASYGVGTEAKKILVLPFPVSFPLSAVSHLKRCL